MPKKAKVGSKDKFGLKFLLSGEKFKIQHDAGILLGFYKSHFRVADPVNLNKHTKKKVRKTFSENGR